VAGREHEITASFLVGCDGAHSRVRHLLDVPFVGQPYPWDWLLADAQLDWDGRADHVHLFAQPDGLPLACVPITRRLWRLSIPTPGDRGGTSPTLEEIQALVEARGPGGMRVSDPETLTSFRCQLRSTSVYRRGRVLLAGDAVHIHSPAGGQGMNTGMLDATNLGWKLARVVTRQAPDRLLDTYGLERGPVAEDVLDFTQSMVKFGTTARSLERTLRDARLSAFRLPAVQRRLAGRLSQVSVRYPDSPLNTSGHLRRVPRPGDRMPDLAITGTEGPSTLHAALRQGRHVLVVSDRAGEADLDRYREFADIVTARLGHRTAIALVRPDGYVAAVATADDGTSIGDHLKEHLGNQAASHLGTRSVVSSG
jgi:hypothetical protein